MPDPRREGASSPRRRTVLLLRWESRLELPMAALGLVWLGLLVVDLTRGLSPLLLRLNDVIWALFIADFAVRFAVAPAKLVYLRRNILTLVSLVLPALRIFRTLMVMRVFGAARAARGVRLLRVITSLNRGMRSLRAALGRRGFGYVASLTALVVFGGAAGMLAFERHFTGYGDALWWTTMMITTMGTERWPVTAEGRLLCVFLALYAFTVFGYITAAMASFFVGQDAKEERGAQPHR